MLALLDKAKAFPLLKMQHPEAVAQVEVRTFGDQPQVTDFNEYEIRIEEIFRFNPEDTLVFHVGMSGHWRIDPAEPDKHDHLLLETDDGRRLALNDARRFGTVDLVATDALGEWPPFAALGPDALGPELDARWFKRRFEGRRAPIKALLLDQRIIAGLGNIYACEALYRAGIHPTRAAGSISLGRLERLAAAIPHVLGEAVAAGGSSLRDFVSPDGTLGYFSARFDVYDREGLACACGGQVKRIVQGGRSTFYCPRCQR